MARLKRTHYYSQEDIAPILGNTSPGSTPVGGGASNRWDHRRAVGEGAGSRGGGPYLVGDIQQMK